jgi:ParB-like chromosome segregation protein Spo0J
MAAGGSSAGHGRVAGARLLGLSEVPAITIEHLTEADLRAYVIADNRLAEKVGLDKDILAIEMQGLIDLEFDVDLTGFETAEIDIFEECSAGSETDSERLNSAPAGFRGHLQYW